MPSGLTASGLDCHTCHQRGCDRHCGSEEGLFWDTQLSGPVGKAGGMWASEGISVGLNRTGHARDMDGECPSAPVPPASRKSGETGEEASTSPQKTGRPGNEGQT